MEKLRIYLNTLTPAEQRAFGVACGTSIGYLRKAISNKQKFGGDLCVQIEKASKRAVRVEDLRPDVDWAYLRDSAQSIAESDSDIVDRVKASDDAQPPVGGSSGKTKK